MRAILTLFVQAALARSYARVIWMFRNRTWLLQETVLPLLSVAAFAYVYRAMNAPEEFVGFVILGAAMTAFWFNVLWSMGAHLYWERDSGNLEIYVASPAPMMGILAGMALGGMTTTCVRALCILLSGVVIFQVPFQPTSWWLLLAVFGLTLVALYGLGMMFASLFLLWGREAWHIVNLLQEPVFLITGLNFPIRIFPTAIAAIGLLIPLTAGMDAMRQILFRSEGFLSVEIETGILAGSAVLFLILAHFCLQYLERRARREGSLGVRWQ